MINLRKPNIEDIEALEQLFQLTRQHTFVLRPAEEFKIGDYVKSTQEDEVWVAEETGVIVGFVSIYVPDNFIHNLFVRPKSPFLFSVSPLHANVRAEGTHVLKPSIYLGFIGLMFFAHALFREQNPE